jgi:hypothetical protein
VTDRAAELIAPLPEVPGHARRVTDDLEGSPRRPFRVSSRP